MLLRLSRLEFNEMRRHLQTYSGTGAGAEQDFFTEFWKHKGGIAGLQRKHNCQLYQVAFLGSQAQENSVYWRMVANCSEEVAHWHFSETRSPWTWSGGASHFQLWKLPAAAGERGGVRRGCSRAMEPVVRRGSVRAIESVV